MFALSPFAFPSISVPTAEGDMELISSTTLTAKSGTISTGTLPTGYRDLVIRGQLRTDSAFSAESVLVAFNGDTTNANYTYVRDISNATQATFQCNVAGSERYVAIAASNNATANAFGVFTLTIYSHEGTTNLKSYNSVSGIINTSTSLNTNRTSGRRASVEAITTISLSPSQGDFVAGSSIAVYGLK